MESPRTVLARVTGRDRPGITAAMLSAVAGRGAEVYDIEQVTTRDRLSLDLLLGLPGDDVGDALLKDLLFIAWDRDLAVDFEVVEPRPPEPPATRHAVTVIGQALGPAALAAVADAIAAAGCNIDRITRLSRYPVVSYELIVAGGDAGRLQAALLGSSAAHGIDVALQREGLERRAKRLVVMDVDSTLIQDEVIDLLAREAGRSDEVAQLTERAMRGEIDFAEALRRRVEVLAGVEEAALQRVRENVQLTPGARTFVRTLKRLGFTIAIVSGGFTAITDQLRDELGIDHAYANELEVADGRLTGRVVGRLVDRERKAQILEEVAAAEGIGLEQTVAVGDGANDLDMLARAGLGIAFNAKPVVRDAADTALSVPYLDAILFVLGIRRSDVEEADAQDPQMLGFEHVPVPGTPPL